MSDVQALGFEAEFSIINVPDVFYKAYSTEDYAQTCWNTAQSQGLYCEVKIVSPLQDQGTIPTYQTVRGHPLWL